MLGAIVGDIIGSRFERNNHKSKDFELFVPSCRVTDDSIMTLAVAEALMNRSSPRLVQAPEDHRLLFESAERSMQRLGHLYPDCGFGGMFSRWVFSDKPMPYHSFGNGAAMRISPVAYVADTQDEVRKLAEIITSVTHDHPEGIRGGVATAQVVFMARKGKSKSEIREFVEKNFYSLDFRIDDIRPSYAFDVTCQGSVPQAIACFLESVSFEDAVRTAVSLGGDSDTLAAISGAIAEAYYGIPEPMVQRALTYLDDELRGIVDRWGKRAAPTPIRDILSHQ